MLLGVADSHFEVEVVHCRREIISYLCGALPLRVGRVAKKLSLAEIAQLVERRIRNA